MRKLLLLLVAVCGISVAVQAQSNVIKTNPIGLAFGNFNATYERVLNEKSSFLLGANYFYKLFGTDVGLFGAQAGYRYYFTHAAKQVPTGFYINPQVGFSTGSLDTDANFSTFGVGAEVGYQWSWASGFTLDLGIGPNYTTISGDVEGDDFGRESLSGVVPSITMAIGYAF